MPNEHNGFRNFAGDINKIKAVALVNEMRLRTRPWYTKALVKMHVYDIVSYWSMYRYYTETRGDIFMPRGEAEGQKYINPSFCVIPDIHTTGKVFSYFTVHSSEYSN